jgi:hypothetical protein
MAASRRIGAVAAAVRVSRGYPPPVRDNAFADWRSRPLFELCCLDVLRVRTAAERESKRA